MKKMVNDWAEERLYLDDLDEFLSFSRNEFYLDSIDEIDEEKFLEIFEAFKVEMALQNKAIL